MSTARALGTTSAGRVQLAKTRLLLTTARRPGKRSTQTGSGLLPAEAESGDAVQATRHVRSEGVEKADSVCEGTPVERAPMRMVPCRTALAPRRVTSVAAKNGEKQVRRVAFERARDSVDGLSLGDDASCGPPSRGLRRPPNQGSTANKSIRTRCVFKAQLCALGQLACPRRSPSPAVAVTT